MSDYDEDAMKNTGDEDAAEQRENSDPTHGPEGKFAPGNKYRFKPGQSGNPKGRAPGRRLSSILDEYLEEVVDYPIARDKKGNVTESRQITRAELFVISQYQQSIKGDQAAAKHIWDRVEGAVRAHSLGASGESSLDILLAALDAADSSKEDAEALEYLQEAVKLGKYTDDRGGNGDGDGQ